MYSGQNTGHHVQQAPRPCQPLCGPHRNGKADYRSQKPSDTVCQRSQHPDNSLFKQKVQNIGETLDIAVGNCLDKIARELGLDNFPSPGLSIEKMARKGSKYIKLPYSIKGMDMSFSGILSYLKRIKNDHSKEDLCYSLQEAMFSILVEGTERCLSFIDSNEVMVVGGVGCNLRLQEMLRRMVEQRGGVLYAMDERFCIDNGAMIAYTGYLMHTSGIKFKLEDCDVTQRFRTDSVDVCWRE